MGDAVVAAISGKAGITRKITPITPS